MPRRSRKLTDPEFRLWRNFVESSLLIETLLDRKLREMYGLLHADYGVLRRLDDAPQNRLRMISLAEQVWFSRSRLAHQMDKLERAGLVERIRGNGRREIYAQLTDQGRQTIACARADVRTVLREHFFSAFEPEQIIDAADALGKVAENLRALPEWQEYKR